MHITRALRAGVVGAVAMIIALAGCQDLEVVNHNNPDRFRALADPSDVDLLIGNTFNRFQRAAYRANTAYPSDALGAMAHELAQATQTGQVRDRIQIPRVPFTNTVTYPGHWTVRRPWDNYYVSISAAVDGLHAIRDGDLEIGPDGQDTHRAQVFGHWMIGVGHMYIALHFDKGYWYDYGMELAEDLDFQNMEAAGFGWVPYDELAENARGALERVVDMIEEGEPFDASEQWFNNPDLTSEDMLRATHSMIARSLAYTPRSPEERAQVDWARVLYHAERGVQDEFGFIRDISLVWRHNGIERTRFGGDARIHLDIVGPADTSGAYQQWRATPHDERVPFFVATPDRRFPQQASNQLQPYDTGILAEDDERYPLAGQYFRYMTGNIGGAGNAPHMNSSYSFLKGGSLAQWREDGRLMPIMTGQEMDFLRAEAYYHLGDREAAAELINKSRVEIGQLPPVTADGVPEGPECVPRNRETGACGTLFEALMYEKRIELAGYDSHRSFADARGWGLLEPGTTLHFPVPARELEAIQQPEYTFGGVGGPGAAP